MRLLLTAALIACAMSAVSCIGWAQEGANAAAAPAPSAAARRALWCGAAFTILSTDQSLAASAAAEYKTKAGTAFGNAAAELIPEGMTVEQFQGLAERIAADVTAPFREETYTREQCDDAATAPAGPTAPAAPAAGRGARTPPPAPGTPKPPQPAGQ
jgi:hypothetical protein